MIERALNVLPLHHAGMDETTLGKSSQLLVPSKRLGTPGTQGLGKLIVRAPGHLSTPGLASMTLKAPDHVVSHRSVVLGSSMSGVETRTVQAPKKKSDPEPMGFRVECAPVVRGGKCDVVFEVQVTLEPYMCHAVHWKKGRSMDGRPVMVV